MEIPGLADGLAKVSMEAKEEAMEPGEAGPKPMDAVREFELWTTSWAKDGHCLLCNKALTDAHLMTEARCSRMRNHVAAVPCRVTGPSARTTTASSDWRPTLPPPAQKRSDPAPHEAERLLAAQITSSKLGQELAEMMRKEDESAQLSPQGHVKEESTAAASSSQGPEDRFDPGAEAATGKGRPLVPRQGVKINAPKVGLLKAIAKADSQSWEGLTQAIQSSKESGSVKASLMEDLERLASQRKVAADATLSDVMLQTTGVKELEKTDDEYLRALEPWMPRGTT